MVLDPAAAAIRKLHVTATGVPRSLPDGGQSFGVVRWSNKTGKATHRPPFPLSVWPGEDHTDWGFRAIATWRGQVRRGQRTIQVQP